MKKRLFNGEYDLNVMLTRRVVDPDVDGTFCDQKEHDLMEKARWERLAVALERDDGIVRDIVSARVDTRDLPAVCQDCEPWDLYVTLGSGENLWPEDDFASVRAGTPAGGAFLARYLPTCRVSCECRSCGQELVGDAALRNQALCQGCEDSMPDYFSRRHE